MVSVLPVLFVLTPPSLPRYHSGPATWNFQSSISVEVLPQGCHQDVQGLLHQQLLFFAMIQNYGLHQVDRVIKTRLHSTKVADLSFDHLTLPRIQLQKIVVYTKVT